MTTEPAVPPGRLVQASHAFDRGAGSAVRDVHHPRRRGVRAAYDSLNLGGAVGDDPAAVRGQPERGSRARSDLPADRLRLAAPGARHDGRSGRPENRWRQRRLPTRRRRTVRSPPSPGIGLAVLVADCIPMLAADAAAGVIGPPTPAAGARPTASRCGPWRRWRGPAPDAGRIQVWLGPAICGACYEVPAATCGTRSRRSCPGRRASTDRGTPGLDLRAGVAAQLRAAGIDRVEVDSRCTRTDPELFSHRARRSDGSAGRPDLDAAVISTTRSIRTGRSDPSRKPVCRTAFRLTGGDSLTARRGNRFGHMPLNSSRGRQWMTTEGSGRQWDHGARWGPSSDSSRTRGAVTNSATSTTTTTTTRPTRGADDYRSSDYDDEFDRGHESAYPRRPRCGRLRRRADDAGIPCRAAPRRRRAAIRSRPPRSGR